MLSSRILGVRQSRDVRTRSRAQKNHCCPTVVPRLPDEVAHAKTIHCCLAMSERGRARDSARAQKQKNHLPVAARATLTRAVTATDALLLATRPLERAQVVQSQSFIIRRDDRRRETLRRSHRAHPERPASVPTRAQRERGHLRRVAVPSVVSRAFQPLARPRFAVAVAHRPSPRPQ